MQEYSHHTAGSRFSAVIVNYNGGAMLTDCVRSAVDEGIAAHDIVVVDNGSRDDSVTGVLAAFPDLQMVRNGCNTGFARAVNQGIQRGTQEFVLLLNNDAQLQPGSLYAFAEAFDRMAKLAIAGGQLCYADGQSQNSVARFPQLRTELVPNAVLEFFFPKRFKGIIAGNGPIPAECVIGACVAVRRDCLRELGLLDEDYFFFFEEVAWCQRARQLGLGVYHVPAARTVHLQGETARRFRGNARVEFQRSKLTFYRKTRSRAVYAWVSIVLAAGSLIDAMVNSALCVATGFAHARFRMKARVYWYLFGWHLLGRPDGWGFPDKCGRNIPRNADERAEVVEMQPTLKR